MALLELAWSAASYAQDRQIYFPLGTWPEIPGVWSVAEQAKFYEDWFGDQLHAMGEPSLSKLSEATEDRHARLLVLPSFDAGMALHLVETNDGPVTLTATRLNGRGGYDPGTIDAQTVYKVSTEDLMPLAERLEGLGAWTHGLPEMRDALCSDGTQFLLEMASKDYLHVILIHNCALLPETEALIAEFLALAPEFQRFCHGCRSPWSK